MQQVCGKIYIYQIIFNIFAYFMYSALIDALVFFLVGKKYHDFIIMRAVLSIFHKFNKLHKVKIHKIDVKL